VRRRLQAIYWRGILLTLLIALAAIGVTAKLAIDDAHSHMRALLQAASMWTMDSNDDFQTLADAIARVSPQLRVTFMMDSGLTLADSADGAEGDANHYSEPEIVAARRGETGQSLRMSQTGATLMLYMARRLSPRLILRLSYPVLEVAGGIALYGALLAVLFLVLYLLQRRDFARFAADQRRQMEDLRRLLDGELDHVSAVFPEYQPDMDAIAYRIHRLRQDQHEILRTMNLRNDFVANASHELRSPLTSVRGYTELLKEGMADTPEERELCLETIMGECDRMLAVIEDILRLSRAERGSEEAVEPIEVAPIAEEVRRSLTPRADRKGIGISVTGEACVPAREQDVWEILYNLMDNAVRYGRPNGHVWVRLSGRRIAVEDDGIGIAPEHAARVFEQFYRVDEARDDAGGTGLGLSIVKAIVEGCNGRLSVESTPGKGTRFLADFERGGIEEKERMT